VSHYHRRTVLERLFDDLNTELFDGRIARCAVRRASYLARRHGCDGLYEPLRQQILIQTGLSPHVERRVLIHEMCHAKLPGEYGHGSDFLSELRRLGRRGEAWAIREADRYANDPWLRVVDALDDLDHQWHTLPRSASTRARSLIIERAERLLARL
jgi:hypothetical protein